MIEFISLLLGLVSGPQLVEVNVVGTVAAVELQLDGREVETLQQPPWRFDCDFGPALVPHELVAIARDSEGQELGRTRQWVNLQQRAVAKAAMVFSGGESSTPRQVGLVWESIGQRQPRSIEVLFDGDPLSFDDPARIPLPAYDPNNVHLVSATLHFRDDTRSRLEATFGAGLGSEIQSELTALAVTLEKGVKNPKPEDLQGWFLKDGKPLKVQGVENGFAEVIVVRDPATQATLEQTTELIELWNLGRAGRRNAFGNLGNKTYVRVLSPAGAPLSPTEVTQEMFVQSELHDTSDQGMLWLSQQTRPQSFPILLPDAVALAGVQAHASTRRRAVVLLLGDSRSLEQAYTAEMARNYLELLRVPFYVWSLDSEPRSEWGDVRTLPLAEDFSKGHRVFKRTVEELRRSLDAQRIVWLEGSHLPQSIELAPQATGLSLAGL